MIVALLTVIVVSIVLFILNVSRIGDPHTTDLEAIEMRLAAAKELNRGKRRIPGSAHTPNR